MLGNKSFNFINIIEDNEAAIQFLKALNENAKKLKQSSPKPTETDNEKYTFRTYLVRLGFIGQGYKKAREVLLKNLQGNGAFRKGRPQPEHSIGWYWKETTIKITVSLLYELTGLSIPLEWLMC